MFSCVYRCLVSRWVFEEETLGNRCLLRIVWHVCVVPYITHTSHSLTAKCIDRYTELKVKQFDGQLEGKEIDSQLEDIVNRMFARCLMDRRYKQAIGVAFEARRLDILERVLSDAVRHNEWSSILVCC